MRRRLAAATLIIGVAGLLTSGCDVLDRSPADVPAGPGQAAAGSDTDVTGWHESWEQAAVSEARRLYPNVNDLGATRIDLAGVGQRVQVEGDGGFCRMYGGMAVKDRWLANELGSCANTLRTDPHDGSS